MDPVEHFTYGVWTPAIAYSMSVTGSLLGLLCTSRSRTSAGRSRAGWLTLAAVSIGGTGIWVMHFIAMLGFGMSGQAIRYDVPLTLLSMLIAIVIVGVGLFMLSGGDQVQVLHLITAGLLTGSGVGTMHYTGMAAVNMHASVRYDPILFTASILIAVIASTVALWFTIAVRGRWVTVAAALVMGVAVSGMHYTGMAAMRVDAHQEWASPHGATALDFLLPLIIGISVITVILVTLIGLSPTEDELRIEADLTKAVALRSQAPAPASGRGAGTWFQAKKNGGI